MAIVRRNPKLKPILWLNDSLRAEVHNWPAAVKQDLGKELTRLELGADPVHYRVMTAVGAGVKEIKITDGVNKDQYRTIYTANFEEAIYVLHVISKKSSRQTAPKDIRAARLNLKALVAWREEKGL